MEALRLINQRRLRELAELNRWVQQPHDEQHTHGGRDIIPQEEKQHLGAPRDDDERGENSRTRGHDPNVPLEDDRNEGMLDKDDGGEESTPSSERKRGTILGVVVPGYPTRA